MLVSGVLHVRVDTYVLVSVFSDYGRQARHTFLDSLFGGQLISTIMCEECKQVSDMLSFSMSVSGAHLMHGQSEIISRPRNKK